VSKHFAIVSIGTNSTRVLLADMAPAVPRVDFTRSIGTRVGEGLQQSGRLDETAMARTLDAVRSHVRAVRGHYLRIFCIATVRFGVRTTARSSPSACARWWARRCAYSTATKKPTRRIAAR